MSDGRELADALEAELDLARGNMIAAEAEVERLRAQADELRDHFEREHDSALAAEAEVERLRQRSRAKSGFWQNTMRERDEAMAEVERLRSTVAATQRVAEDYADLDRALAPDAKAQSGPIADQCDDLSAIMDDAGRVTHWSAKPVLRPIQPEPADLDARLRRLGARGEVRLESEKVESADRRWCVSYDDDRHPLLVAYGPTPTAAVAALEAAMEGDDANTR